MNIVVVIVTYNRLEKLKKTLDSYEVQADFINSLVVVNNFSNDGTTDFLKGWRMRKSIFQKYVINLENNQGGSGGFYMGEKFAMSLNPDWIYVADDDAYAMPNMMKSFIDYVSVNDVSKVSAICGTVYEINNSVSLEHRSRITYRYGFIYTKENVPLIEYNNSFELDALSYVCSFIKADAIKKIGYCIPEFFIYFDDTEHSLRLKKEGKIICVPSIGIHHDGGGTQIKKDDGILLDWRKYYSLRNQIYTLLHHNPISAFYEVLFEGQHLLRHYGKSKACRKMIITAIKDGICGNLGKHVLYKPGFSIKRNESK